MTMIVFLAALLLPVFYIISVYNRLVTFKNRFKNGFSQIDVQLQRRYDLIPNLIESAKAFMFHEKNTLEAVIAARDHAQATSKLAANAPDNQNAINALCSAESTLEGEFIEVKFITAWLGYELLKLGDLLSHLCDHV